VHCFFVLPSRTASPSSPLLLKARLVHLLSELALSTAIPCALRALRFGVYPCAMLLLTQRSSRSLLLRTRPLHSFSVPPWAPPRRPTVCTAPRALLLFAHGTPSSLPAFTRARYLLHFSSLFLFDKHLSARATCAMLLHTHWVRVLSALIHVDILQLHPLRVFSRRTSCTPLIL
jgi:hypothetical protein